VSNHLTQGQKAELLHSYFTRYEPSSVVETGVWEGHGSCFQFKDKATVIAIEANDDSAERARQNGYHVITGDSGTILPGILDILEPPVMFWLDAHTVEWIDGHGSCPIIDELAAIKEWKHGARSIVLIDDMRMMDDAGWPGTETLLSLAGDTWNVENRDDILRLTPW